MAADEKQFIYVLVTENEIRSNTEDALREMVLERLSSAIADLAEKDRK